jgi:hypothetical protein
MAVTGAAVPEALLGSPLLRSGGFAVYQGLPDAATFAALYAEAAACQATAVRQEHWQADAHEGRGGIPRRALFTAGGGPVQDALYGADWLQRFLAGQCGLPVVPSGNRGSYSYYASAGDFLDLHQDVDTCDLAMISVLHDGSDPAAQSGALVVYPSRIGEPLPAIRASPRRGACVVKVQPGQTIVMLGGILAHRVLPVAEHQLRCISVICFRALAQRRSSQP